MCITLITTECQGRKNAVEMLCGKTQAYEKLFNKDFLMVAANLFCAHPTNQQTNKQAKTKTTKSNNKIPHNPQTGSVERHHAYKAGANTELEDALFRAAPKRTVAADASSCPGIFYVSLCIGCGLSVGSSH